MAAVGGWSWANIGRRILAAIRQTSIYQSISRSEIATITGGCNELITIFGYVRMEVTTDDVPMANEI
jgi:hypothetical protein